MNEFICPGLIVPLGRKPSQRSQMVVAPSSTGYSHEPAGEVSEPVARLIERLDGVRPTARGFMALCPAHDDHRRSLSVDQGDDGRCLIRCFAGCKPRAVVAAVGLTLADLSAGNPAVVVASGGRPVGVLTRADLLEYLARQQSSA